MKCVEIFGYTHTELVEKLADKHDLQFFILPAEPTAFYRFHVKNERVQALLDDLDTLLGAHADVQITVSPIEVFLPLPKTEVKPKKTSELPLREQLLGELQRGTQSDTTYWLLVILSTVVATVGLLQNNTAVIIGAMVIAPFLGPNLGMGLGAALGEWPIIKEGALTFCKGILAVFILAALTGLLYLEPIGGIEIDSRTAIGPATIVLALASGAAGALSLTSGVSSVLVGVMVAVALLPPTVTCGLLAGQQEWHRALGAFLLLAVNVTCVNLTCKLVFFFKGVRPRTKDSQQSARRIIWTYIIWWLIALGILAIAGWFHLTYKAVI